MAKTRFVVPCRYSLRGKAAVVALLVALDDSVARAASTQQLAPSGSVWTAMLLLFAAAAIVERTIELIWNYVEALVLGMGSVKPSSLHTPQYIQFKSGTSLLAGAVLGILVANFTGIGAVEHFRPLMPNLLGGIPTAWDVLITGLLIGVTAKPVHDLLGILTQFKHLLGSNAVKQREAAGAALADGVLKLAQSEAQSMVDVPGIGPTRLGAPGSLAKAEGEEETAATSVSDSERLIKLLHEQTPG